MTLSLVDLEWIRDEIGSQAPPSDDDLSDLYAELANRTLVALRVLKRRRADLAAGGGVDSFTLTGVFSVAKKADIKALDSAIARLEALYLTETGQAVNDAAPAVSSGYLSRNDRAR